MKTIQVVLLSVCLAGLLSACASSPGQPRVGLFDPSSISNRNPQAAVPANLNRYWDWRWSAHGSEGGY